MGFTGFSKQTFDFLQNLADHNDRDWFLAHKADYEQFVQEPALEFIRAMADRLPAVAPHLQASDKKVGGSLMRVHRDTRFSKDKAPYKTNVGIQFRHSAGKDVHAVGLYVHLDPGEQFVALGMYGPEAPVLKQIRDHIVAEPARWAKVTKGLHRGMEGGLQKVPRGYPADHRFADDLKLKSHMASWAPKRADVLKGRFVDDVIAMAQEASPFAAFLCEAIGQPW